MPRDCNFNLGDIHNSIRDMKESLFAKIMEVEKHDEARQVTYHYLLGLYKHLEFMEMQVGVMSEVEEDKKNMLKKVK